MQVNVINGYNYLKNNVNQATAGKYHAVNFSGGKQQLVAVAKEDFKTENAKKLYSTIQNWFKRIGNSGNINDVKIISEKLEFYDTKTMTRSLTDVDTLMSIRKDLNNAHLKLYRVYPGNDKSCVLSADFDKDGQMVKGNYSISNLKFERTNQNTRRLSYGGYYGRTFLPHGDNDREWGLPAELTPGLAENSTSGLFEIFIELARLHTTLYK